MICPHCGKQSVSAVYRKVVPRLGGHFMSDGGWEENLECGHQRHWERNRRPYLAVKRRCQPCTDARNAESARRLLAGS